MALVIESAVENCTGYIVIDSFDGGTSSGGTRITSDVELEEIKALAREMTFKFRFFDLKRGGAKSGIRVPSGLSKVELRQALQNFGASIAPIIQKGLYYPGTDLGCGPEELAAIYRGAGIELGPQTDTAFYTAMTVGAALEVCKEVWYGKETRVRVAIEGFGKVGAHLAERLDPSRYIIIAVSTAIGARCNEKGFDPAKLVAMRGKYGDDFVIHFSEGSQATKEEVLAADADILVPSARTWSIRPDNAGSIKAHVIVPAANVPYAAGSLDILKGKDVLCIPGFVSNAGGVLGSTLKDRGMSEAHIQGIVDRLYRPLVESLVLLSKKMGASPVALAEESVLKNKSSKKPFANQSNGIMAVACRLLARSRFVRRRNNARYIDNVLDNLSEKTAFFASGT